MAQPPDPTPYRETAPGCPACNATGKEDGANCQLCDGSGYIDWPRIDTPAKLRRALEEQRRRDASH